tara:strand:+ start:347 stop:550 length:204 start_codon:yes stop_codon:yes gene_type:complete
MWTLIITSYVMVEVASGAVHSQIKLTKYDQYESFMDCEIEKSLLKLSFENNENAICIDTKTERKLDE